jgi:hypothetical protein
MNAHPHLPRFAALLLGLCITSARAEDKPKLAPANPAEAAKNALAKPPPTKPPTEAELRTVITKGLGFLAKDGEAWMESKDCNGCHHLPEMLRSHREAKRRGFDIDRKKFDEWLTWADDHSKNIKPGSEMVALMKLAMPDRPAPELTKIIAADQQPDGSWKPAGQFTGQKRGTPDAQANSTRIFLLALATPDAAAPEAEAARAKAAAFLAKKDASTSIESLVFRTIYARSTGAAAEADALRAQILKQQRGDGGWSYIVGENMSDAHGTGQALLALQPSASDPATAQAVARAQRWLVQTQREDGSWPSDFTRISKGDRSAPEKAKSAKDATMIYTYFGSGWATIGLLQGVPLKDAATK